MEQTAHTAYDTHAAVRQLTDAGMPERQAEAVVNQVARIFGGNLATKADIEKSRQDTKTDIEKSRLETDAKLETLRTEIQAAKNHVIGWVVGVVLGASALVTTLLKLL